MIQLLYLFASIYCVSLSADIWIRRNLENSNLYEFDSTQSAPSEIARVRLLVTTAQIRNGSSSLPVHLLRVRWSEAINAAAYRVHCEANTTDHVIILIDREILDNVTGLDERFVLPEGKLSVICGVASANSFGSSKWTYSSVVTIQTSSAIPSINDNEPITPIDYKRLTADDLSMDQLLKLIHSSHVEDLPSKLIESSPGMRFVVTPKSEVGSSSADISVDSFVVNSQLETTSPLPTLLSSAVDSEDVVKLEPELSEDAVGPDYKLVEERVRQAIGADEPSSIEKLRYLQAFGLIDRVL
ncbi:hypothetical protein RB195_004678 [Necator americanus]|uniref:Uncharacterized protein n=1 Tax=Necator americanus TaxID=51031 RepID=A0ABR1BL48_NECAM